jgi:hypothetical protein
VTTLLDPRQATTDDLGALYRARWNAELDRRSIKAAMPMRDLRGKPPARARKAVRAHALAYNLIRTVMARAAAAHGDAYTFAEYQQMFAKAGFQQSEFHALPPTM